MAFEGLTQRLQQAFGKVRGKGSLTEEDVKASYESGVLHVKFPKQEALKAPEKKTILIEG